MKDILETIWRMFILPVLVAVWVFYIIIGLFSL